MADIEISVEGGTSKRLLTAGKYCDKNILVSASGGASPVIEPLEVTTNGTYTAPAGVDGYSPVTVNVSGSSGERDLVDFSFFTKSLFARVPAIPSCTYTQNGEMKTYSRPGVFKVDKNSILYVFYELANGFEIIGDCKIAGGQGTTYISLFVQGEGSGIELASGSSGGTNSITDTQALNIITGGEEV